MAHIRKLLVLLLATLLGMGTALAQERGPVVLAAASLQEAMNAAADAWAAGKHPRPVISFAGSSALARQIEAGAPADLFISADEEWMDYIGKKGLLRSGSRTSFLSNRLVLIAPAASKVRITIGRGFPLARALGSGRLAMADPDAVPAGKYGKEALQYLAIWPAVRGKVARAENVRAALALVERGEAPFGIVYATDAKASRKVRVVGMFPAASHTPITYPVAVVKRTTHRDAERFRLFLVSRQGKAIFARYGFIAR